MNKEEPLVCKAHIDGGVQIVLPPLLQLHVLMMLRYSPTPGHPCHRRVYDAVRSNLYWHHTAAGAGVSYATARAGSGIAQSTAIGATCSYSRQVDHLHSLPRILSSPSQKSCKVPWTSFFITDRYSKQARIDLISRTTATHVVKLFMYHWFNPYNTPSYLLTINCTKFVNVFFAEPWALFGVQNLTAQRTILRQSAMTSDSTRPSFPASNTT